MSLKDLIADVNVNEICEHIETETLSEWVNAWQETAISALRPVSRERVEKVWRGEWEKVGSYAECKKCGHMPTNGKNTFLLALWERNDGRGRRDDAEEIGGTVWR